MMKKNKKCTICYGYGFWPIGDLVPIGEFDSKDWGNRVIMCPWCKKGSDNKSERYKFLDDRKKSMEKDEGKHIKKKRK